MLDFLPLNTSAPSPLLFLVYTIRMEHEQLPPTASIPHQFIEKKTISLVTPPCPFGDSNESNTTEVAIVVSQGDAEIARMSFTYIARELVVHFRFTRLFFFST